jgi:hypothetical protein
MEIIFEEEIHTISEIKNYCKVVFKSCKNYLINIFYVVWQYRTYPDRKLVQVSEYGPWPQNRKQRIHFLRTSEADLSSKFRREFF